MMNRISKESHPGGRNAAGGPQHLRRGRELAAGGGSRDGDESLDLFARIHRYPLISSTIESGSQNGLFKTSMGSAKLARSGADDLLSADIGKTDYDWLLTPPGTPLFPSSDASEHQLSSTAPRSSSNVRSVSATKASRFSVSQSENGQSTRPTRSSSATRPSLSSTNSSSYFSNNNRTSLLNTSSVSVTSRPTTPGKRPTTASSTGANSAPASRSVPSRPSTPSRARTSSSSSGDNKSRQIQNSRPSTPTARSHVPSTNSNSSSSTSTARSNSRPSTPTRRNTTPTPAPTTSNSRPSTPNRRNPMLAPAPATARSSSSVGRIPTTNSRNPAPGLRPGSPGPRARFPPPAQTLALSDFPHNVQPNIRTKLPERPISAGKQRPGVPLTVQAKPNSEAAASMSLNRGRHLDNSPKERSRSNGQDVRLPEIKKSTAVGRPTKPASSTESTGFGRTISKKSLDMALRHMDIRQGMGGIRGASLFPQSIRPATSKGVPVRIVEKAATHDDERMSDLTSGEDGNHNGMISSDSNLAISEDGEGVVVVSSAERESDVARVHELDIYESSRYDAILLKEDSKNLNWLHSIEDTSNQSPVFDHRFEPLPEPFSLI